MRQYDDETVGAYVDGELDPETASDLEAALRRDTTLRTRVAELRMVNEALREIGAQIDREAGPAWLPAVDVLKGTGRPRRMGRSLAAMKYHALAAGVALIIGIGIGQAVHLRPPPGSATADEATRRLLQTALEREVSGQEISWSDAETQRTVTVQPLRTYRTEGTFCREYRETSVMAQREGVLIYGLACRTPEGIWDVAYTFTPGSSTSLAHH